MLKKHKQTVLIHPKTKEAISIDVRLAELIMSLWDIGINTFCSCQNASGSGYGYISLADSRHRRFKADRKNALELLSDFGHLVPVWFDLSPNDAMLRFRTRDIKKLTQVMKEGV